VIPHIAPATVTFAQLLFLVRVRHSERQVVWVQMFARILEHLLHFGYDCGRLAVSFLVMNSTAKRKTSSRSEVFMVVGAETTFSLLQQ
jgi:hypothetical protein